MPNQASRVTRDLLTTVLMICLAAAEFVFGNALHNPAVSADGGHSATDAVSTMVSAVMKLLTGNHPSHRVRVHVPARIGIGICWATIISITVVTALQILSPIRVTAQSAITAIALGIVGAIVRYELAKIMERGGEPTDIANAGHLRTDALVSVVLGICGLAVLLVSYSEPLLGTWLFRIAALWILYKAYRANRHISQDIQAELKSCSCRPGNGNTQLDELRGLRDCGAPWAESYWYHQIAEG